MNRHDPVWLTEAAPGMRFGVKGPRAAEALRDAGLMVPQQPNSWAALHAAESADRLNVIGRLGVSEFFIEERAPAAGIEALQTLLAGGLTGAYPVLREDFGLVLGGAAANEALAQVCNVNLHALPLDARPVVMTLMIGVAVLVLPQESDAGGTEYRIWCDPTYGAYLWTELEEIVARIKTGKPQ
jgi:sarcosine oxidase, subunit gamma